MADDKWKERVATWTLTAGAKTNKEEFSVTLLRDGTLDVELSKGRGPCNPVLADIARDAWNEMFPTRVGSIPSDTRICVRFTTYFGMYLYPEAMIGAKVRTNDDYTKKYYWFRITDPFGDT